VANKFIDPDDLTDPPPNSIKIDGICYQKVGGSSTPPAAETIDGEFESCLDCDPDSLEYEECPSGATIFVDPSILDNPPWPLTVEISSVCYEFVGPSNTDPDTFAVDEQFDACDPSVTCCCDTGVEWRYCSNDTVFGAMPPNHVPQDFCWAHPLGNINVADRPQRIYKTNAFAQPVIEPCYIVNLSTVRVTCPALDYSDFNEPWTEVWANNAVNNESPRCYIDINTGRASSFSGNGGGTVASSAVGFLSINQTFGDWDAVEYTGDITGEFSVEVTTSNVSYVGGSGGGGRARQYNFQMVAPFGQGGYGALIRIDSDGVTEHSAVVNGISRIVDISASVSFGPQTIRIERDALNDLRVKVGGVTYHTVNTNIAWIGVEMNARCQHGTSGSGVGLKVDWGPITWTGG
jgi:hypothetical protein